MQLQERLDRIREGAKKRFPAEKLAIMHRATDALRASGIMDTVVKVGDQMPGFALRNTHGEVVRSADLLAQGPLVVGFFRGKW